MEDNKKQDLLGRLENKLSVWKQISENCVVLGDNIKNIELAMQQPVVRRGSQPLISFLRREPQNIDLNELVSVLEKQVADDRLIRVLSEERDHMVQLWNAEQEKKYAANQEFETVLEELKKQMEK